MKKFLSMVVFFAIFGLVAWETVPKIVTAFNAKTSSVLFVEQSKKLDPSQQSEKKEKKPVDYKKMLQGMKTDGA